MHDKGAVRLLIRPEPPYDFGPGVAPGAIDEGLTPQVVVEQDKVPHGRCKELNAAFGGFHRRYAPGNIIYPRYKGRDAGSVIIEQKNAPFFHPRPFRTRRGSARATKTLDASFSEMTPSLPSAVSRTDESNGIRSMT